MKIAVGSDEKTDLTDYVIEELKARGHEVTTFGSLVDGKPYPWPKVGYEVAEMVAEGRCDQGVLFCWTGTGVSIAANKVPGIRAVLCTDAEQARGARKWDHANLLCLSLRLTSTVVAKEILDAWFSTPYDEKEKEIVKLVEEIEQRYAIKTQARAAV